MVKTSNKSDILIIAVAFIVTVIFTPVNFDALIIPKVFILFCFTLYLLPNIIIEIKTLKVKKKSKLLAAVLPIFIFIQLIAIMLISSAPLDQQLFGRTGRGFGLVTYFSFIILTIASVIYIDLKRINLLVLGLLLSVYVSSFYSILQRHNLDMFNWNSRTNGIIGTLGNPNFQSSFATLAVLPTIVYFWQKKNKLIWTPFFTIFLLYTIYICESTQGYIGLAASVIIFIFIRVWFYSKKFFYILLPLPIFMGIIALLGMTNRGPLSTYLYKVSVQSRGDFWRSAFTTANENPIFGVGLDSFGDYYLLNRDDIAAGHTFAELTDNAHNYFLEFAAIGGYPLAAIYLSLMFYTLFCFIKLFKQSSSFNPLMTALFTAWTVLQLQSVISPGNLVLFMWNFLISGSVIGYQTFKRDLSFQVQVQSLKPKVSIAGSFLLIFGVIFLYPWFDSDRMLLNGLNTKNANIVIDAVDSYPRSIVKINLVGVQLLQSNLAVQSLDLARSTTKWNPNSPSGWGLILANPKASREERLQAKAKVLQLDPKNNKVKEFNP